MLSLHDALPIFGDRGVDEFAGLVHRLDEAFLVRFGGVDQTPRIAPVDRILDADEARQEPARRGFGYDPAPCEHKAIARGVAREPRVHRQRHRRADTDRGRSEEQTSELQSLMRISYAVF